MTNKRNRFYQIGFFIITFAFITLCAYMGITAIQKSLTLNLSFQSNPAMLVKIEIYNETDKKWDIVFQNSGETIIQSGVILSGNTLSFSNGYQDTLGITFIMKITNQNTNKDLLSKFSGASVTSNDNPITSVVLQASETTSELSVSVVDKVVIEFIEVRSFSITYKNADGTVFNGIHIGDYPTAHTVGTPTQLTHAVKTDSVFAGWYDNSNFTGNPIETLGATDYSSDITLYAKWETSTNEINGYNFNLRPSSSDFKDYQTGTSGSYYLFNTIAGQYTDANRSKIYSIEWIVLGGSIEANYKGGSETTYTLDSVTHDYIPNETLFLSETYGKEWYATTTKFYIKEQNEWKEVNSILLLSRYLLGTWNKGYPESVEARLEQMYTTNEFEFNNQQLNKIHFSTLENQRTSGYRVFSFNAHFFTLGADYFHYRQVKPVSFNVSKYFGKVYASGYDETGDIAKIAYTIETSTSSTPTALGWWLADMDGDGASYPACIWVGQGIGVVSSADYSDTYGLRPAFVLNLA